jgi:hypothetical protein
MRSAGLFLALALVGASTTAIAQDDGPRCERRVRDGRVEIVCGETHIEGSSPRPYVLLGRSRDRHDAPTLDRELAREIPRTVRRSPF